MLKLESFNKDAYDKKYDMGYGIQYPDGHIIRFYERFLKYELGLHIGKVLDFGCGNGIHSKYLESKGFECYGVDISVPAINQAKMNCKNKDSFKTINQNDGLVDIFPENYFDIIIANQSLYYNDNTNLETYVTDLYNLTKKGGIVFFSMMSTENCMYQCVEGTAENGLSKVVLDNRLHEITYINFTHSVDELQNRFAPFTPVHVGAYDLFGYYDGKGEDGSGHHYFFIGRKE